MIPLEAWETFGHVLAAIGALGAGAFGLQKLGILRLGGSATPPTAPPDERVAHLERTLAELQLHIAEHYMRREDWVPWASQMIGMMENLNRASIRIEERTASRRHENG